MNKFILFILFPLLSFSQTQIGQTIYGGIQDGFGTSTSISSDGSIIAIGANSNDAIGINSGSVRIYEKILGIWTQIGQDINGEADNDHSGYSISLSSDGVIIAIGAHLNNGNGVDSGSVRIYQNISGIWTQIGQDINGEAANDYSGLSVSLSANGNIVAIGAPSNDENGTDSGHVRIYQNLSGIWTQIGQDINGEAANDHSGISISISKNGTIVAIGAPSNNGNGFSSGHVRIYQNLSGIWTQIGQDIDGEANNDISGVSVSLSANGSIVAIGAPNNFGSFYGSGHVRIYQNILGFWIQIGQDINGEGDSDGSGNSVSLDNSGNIVAIGARGNDGNGQASGHVRIYENLSGIWTQISQDIDGQTVNNNFGYSVSLSQDGTNIAIGAENNNGNLGSGYVKIYDLSAILSSDNFIQSNFSLYPNPTSALLTVNLQENLVFEKAIIYATSGQIIKKETTKTFNVSNLSKGTYFIEIVTDKGKATKSFIVQ